MTLLRAWSRHRLLASTLATLTSLTAPAVARAQQGTITGRITAVGTNEPLVDARVMVVNTTGIGSANAEGRYTIRNVPPGQMVVRVIRVGYAEQKKSVNVNPGATVTLDFTLEAAVVKLAEVVTTATGEQRKVELGNTVAVIDVVSARRRVADQQHERSARRQSAGLERAAAEHDRVRRADPHPRSQLGEPRQRADLHHRRHPDGRGHRLQHRRHELQPAQRHHARGDRQHRDREGPLGRDALRHGRGERRHRHHDQEGPAGQHALGVDARERLGAGPQSVPVHLGGVGTSHHREQHVADRALPQHDGRRRLVQAG